MFTMVRPSYAGGELDPVIISDGWTERRVEVPSIAVDQSPFAVRLQPWRSRPVPGLAFSARTIELASGRFTNSFDLTVDLERIRVTALSASTSFHLTETFAGPTVVAAASGTFAFSSDDPTYAPPEPCLDLCFRGGQVVSLPTATKPALIVDHGRPFIRTLAAHGTLRIDGQPFRWVGSKVPADECPVAADEALIVYGPANCRVEYSGADRTGFLRYVDRARNATPEDPRAIDFVVCGRGDGHVVTSARAGGGTDLFEGSYILRARSRLARFVRVGARVQVCTVDGLDCADLDSGFSVGPSVADAARGHVPAYDASLGVSPFGSARAHARTLIGLSGSVLSLRVLDGAPLTSTFQGVSAREAEDLLITEAVDPRQVYHLDGGQSSKMAFVQEGAVTILGSMHYLRWPSPADDPFRWQGRLGRRLHSAVCLET